MPKLVISTNSPAEANQLVEALSNPMNAYDVAMAGNNTVEVVLDEDKEAALELLAQIAAAQPQYIALGIETPLADALKQTGKILAGRGAQIDAAVDAAVNGNGNYLNSRTWAPKKDPMTLDLDGDGLETTGIDPTNPILFDHDGDGVKNATGWISPDDGFLVLDRNGNGVIDNGAELFGDSTPLYSGGNATDGFSALEQEDTNGDGIVNNQDTNFSSLRIWQDENSMRPAWNTDGRRLRALRQGAAIHSALSRSWAL
jgi:hypothetical protein